MNQLSKLLIRRTCFFVLLVQLFAVQSSFGAPVWDAELAFNQPDGSKVPCRMFGDEFYHRLESPNGYTIIRDEQTKWLVYASLDKSGDKFISTSLRYNGIDDSKALAKLGIEPGLQISKRARRELVSKSRRSVGLPDIPILEPNELIGDMVGLTLLIDFSDCPAALPKEEIHNLMNQEGYNDYNNNGSIHDYFYDVSGGKFNYTNTVNDYYRAENPKSWYLDAEIGSEKLNDLITSALTDLESQGFDFNSVTITEFSTIGAINILYAGFSDTEIGVGLWPHMGHHTGFETNGIFSDLYQITDIGDSLSIGVILHENGHMIGGYPDLYDYDKDSFGVGWYCLMGYGGGSIAEGPSKNPVPPNPYYRHLSGWDDVIDLTKAGPGVYTHVANSNTSFIFENPSYSAERFYIESRRRVGRNRHIPDNGLVIWHVDKNASNEFQQMTPFEHYMVSVEQADFQFDLENNINKGDANDLYPHGELREFNDKTSPNANWWSGNSSGILIHSISDPGPEMTFAVGYPEDDTDTETETDTDSDTDTDTGEDTESDDTDSSTAEDDDETGGNDSCGCHGAGSRSHHNSLFSLITHILIHP